MEDHAREGSRMMEPKLAKMTKKLFKIARSTSSDLLCGAVMYFLLAITSIHSKSPCHRVAPVSGSS